MMMAATPAGDGGEALPAAKTEFDVVLTGFGDKKLNVVKVVKNMTGATLMDAKKLVESVPVDDQGEGLQGRRREGEGRVGRSRWVGRTQVVIHRFSYGFVLPGRSWPGGMQVEHA